jgi:hypothetical protein
MNVSGVSSATNPFSNYLQSKYNQQIQDFQGLASAVQSGDLSTAQTALTAFQKDIQNNPQGPLATALSDPNSQISKDFQALQTALQSNDATSAQSAFATFAQDLQALHHHRHHHDKADSDSTQSTANTSGTNSTSSLVGVNLNEQV